MAVARLGKSARPKESDAFDAFAGETRAGLTRHLQEP